MVPDSAGTTKCYQHYHCLPGQAAKLESQALQTAPPRAFPFLKWVGHMPREGEESEWIPILARLDSISLAKEACSLFCLLGYGPIIVEYQSLGIYDIFLKEDDIPAGAWIVLETDDDYDLHEIQPSPFFYDEDDETEFDVPLDSR